MAVIDKGELKWWAGLAAAVALAIGGAVNLPHPWDQVTMGIAAAAGAIAMYNVNSTPKGDS